MKINEKYLNCIDSDFYIGGMNGMITEKGLFISSDGEFVKDEKWIEIRGNKLIFDNPINEGQIECVKRFLIHHSRTDEGIDVIYKGKECEKASYYKIDDAMEWLLNECNDDLIYGKTFLDRCNIGYRKYLYEIVFNGFLFDKNILTETHHVNHDFDSLISELSEYIFNRLKNDDDETPYVCNYAVKFIYGTHPLKIIFDYSDKHIENGFVEHGWHLIFFNSINAPSEMMRMGNARGMGIVKNAKDYDCTPIHILINKATFNKTNIKDIKEALRHEFTHVLASNANLLKDANNSTKGKFAQPNRDGEIIRNNQYANIIRHNCAMLSPQEHNSYISETYQAILDLDDKTVDSLKKQIGNNWTLCINTLMQYTFLNNRLMAINDVISLIDNIDFKNPYDLYSLLLYGYFFNKYEQINSNSEYLTLDFINSLSKLSIKDIDDKQLESIQIKLLQRMKFQYHKYIRRLKEVIIDAAIERGIVDLYKNEIKTL